MARWFLYFFIIYLVIEGALRKWAFPSLSIELFLLKDVFILFASISYLLSSKQHFNYIKHSEIVAWAGWVFLVIGYFVASGLSLTGLIGLRYYLVFVPILFLFPSIILSYSKLDDLVRIYLFFTVLVCIIGVIQYFSPYDSILNVYANQDENRYIAVFGYGETIRARITGTFSYITPYTFFLMFMFFVSWGFFILSKVKTDRFIGIISIILIIINIIMTGSRGPFLTIIVFSLPFIYYLISTSITNIKIAYIFILSLALAFTVGYVFLDALELLLERNVLAEDSAGRIEGALLKPVATLKEAGMFGIGIGETFMGTGGEFKFDEVKQDRIGIEVGVFGYIYFMLIKIAFLIKTFLLFVNTRDFRIKIWSLVALSIQASLLWLIPFYQTVAFAFYMMSLGLFFWLRCQDKYYKSYDVA